MGYVSEIENIKKIENELSNSNNLEKDIYQRRIQLINSTHIIEHSICQELYNISISYITLWYLLVGCLITDYLPVSVLFTKTIDMQISCFQVVKQEPTENGIYHYITPFNKLRTFKK